jgi:hypothetical protein
MVKYDGRLVWKQYMQKKPIKWGIKIWCLCDPHTGYCLTLDVYTGAGDNDDDIKTFGLGYTVVMRLMQQYLLSYHKLYADSYFSSVTLAEDLHASDTYYTGTIRTDRKDFPSEMTHAKLRYTEKIRWKKETSSVVACRFRDKNRDVYLISTCHGSTDVNKPRTRYRQGEIISVPTFITDYNKYMGGVDHLDQFRSYYSVGRTGRKWWKYLFWGLLNFAIVNAYILWCQLNRPLPPGRRHWSLKAFKLGLVHELADSFSSRKRTPAKLVAPRNVLEIIQRNVVQGHDKVRFQGRKKICAVCNRNNRRTHSGRHVETSYGCSECNIPLCKDNDCFVDFHDDIN